LTEWVDLGLKRALTAVNIQKGFASTGIWPYNSQALEKKMGPNRLFHSNTVVPGPKETVGMVGCESVLANVDVSASIDDHNLSNTDNNGAAHSPSQSGSDKDKEDEDISANDEGLQEIRGDRVIDSQ